MRRNRYGIRGDWGRRRSEAEEIRSGGDPKRRRSEAEEIRSGGDCIPLWDSDGFTATIADALNPSPGSPLRKLEEQIQLPLDKYGVRDDVGTTALSFTSSTKMLVVPAVKSPCGKLDLGRRLSQSLSRYGIWKLVV